MSELMHQIRRPLAFAAVALASLSLTGCLDGGDKTFDIGVACGKGEKLGVLSANTGWDGYLTLGCINEKGKAHSLRAVKLPNQVLDGSVKPNFNLSVKANNYGALWWTQQAVPAVRPNEAQPYTTTIHFDNTDVIKDVKITKTGQ